jgi:hypothetical protein
MMIQWAFFLCEARGPNVRPGGNGFLNIPIFHKLLGHLLLQIVAIFVLIASCAVVGARAQVLNPPRDSRYEMISVSAIREPSNSLTRLMDTDHLSIVYFP